MPCSDKQPLHIETVYRDKAETLRKVEILEGIACALVNEIDKRGILDSVVTEAQKNGQVNIVNWIRDHEAADRKRLEGIVLSTFSVHERRMIKRMMDDGELL